MNDSELYMNSIANTFREEPVFNCPQCNAELQTDWVDKGFGPYSVQASPYGCECGWHETGCKECIKERCFSWEKCQGRALIVNPLADSPALNTMNNFDPNAATQQAEGQEATNDQVQATEQEAQEKALESAEEGTTEG